MEEEIKLKLIDKSSFRGLNYKEIQSVSGGAEDTTSVTVTGGGNEHGAGGQFTVSKQVTPDTTISISVGADTNQGVNSGMVIVTKTWG